jgi:hypothetical protein
MFTYPTVHDVGIDTVLQCHSSNGRAWKRACIDNLQLEFRTVEPAFGDLGGASFARHGVHDVHRAHYLNSSVGFQDGTAGRLRKGDCWDNAPTESFWGRLKVGRLYGRKFETRRQAMDEVIDWMTFYNHRRIHSTLGYISPMQFEKSWYEAQRLKAA